VTITGTQFVLKHITIVDEERINRGMMICGRFVCFCGGLSVDADSKLYCGKGSSDLEMGLHSDKSTTKTRKGTIKDCDLFLHLYVPSMGDEATIRLEGNHSPLCAMQENRKAMHPTVESELALGILHGVGPQQLIVNAYNTSSTVHERRRLEFEEFTTRGGSTSARSDFSPAARSRGARFSCMSRGGAEEETVLKANVAAGGTANSVAGGALDAELEAGEEDLAETAALVKIAVQMSYVSDMRDVGASADEGQHSTSGLTDDVMGNTVNEAACDYKNHVKPPPHASTAEKEEFAVWFQSLYRSGESKNLPSGLWSASFALPRLITDYNLTDLKESVGHVIHSSRVHGRHGRSCTQELYSQQPGASCHRLGARGQKNSSLGPAARVKQLGASSQQPGARGRQLGASSQQPGAEESSAKARRTGAKQPVASRSGPKASRSGPEASSLRPADWGQKPAACGLQVGAGAGG
jgi:hypothetical protein